MLQKIRRVVTGHNAAGKAVILLNDHAPNANLLKGWPGAGVTEIWVTDESSSEAVISFRHSLTLQSLHTSLPAWGRNPTVGDLR